MITLIFTFLSVGYAKFTKEEIQCRYPELNGCEIQGIFKSCIKNL